MFSTRCLQEARSFFGFQNVVSKQVPFNSVTFCRRLISTNATLCGKYYDTLGISPRSTQNEIKAAYYKLSMVYHPDKNKGSESAAQKFREITQAYEVLSNYRLRRLYDKGVIHTAGPAYAETEVDKKETEDVEDDPQTKFYKSRFTKSTVTNQSGQRPIYNFDEWAKAHYGKSFDRKKSAKERQDRNAEKHKSFDISLQNDRIIFGALIFFLGLYLIIYAEQSHDVPKVGNQKED